MIARPGWWTTTVETNFLAKYSDNKYRLFIEATGIADMTGLSETEQRAYAIIFRRFSRPRPRERRRCMKMRTARSMYHRIYFDKQPRNHHETKQNSIVSSSCCFYWQLPVTKTKAIMTYEDLNDVKIVFEGGAFISPQVKRYIEHRSEAHLSWRHHPGQHCHRNHLRLSGIATIRR